MLKLKDLYDNPALAKMLLANWDYDASSLSMLEDYRISANAVYPFKRKDELCFLRFCPTSEKSKDNILAELEFIHYLRRARYNALEPLPSKMGAELIQKTTPWGEYYACAFQRVQGEALSDSNFEKSSVFAYGAALGRLHQLSSQYTPIYARRWTHTDVFAWIETTLGELAPQGAAWQELGLLRGYFAALPINSHNYGLIHYDFEPDNVFYDATSGVCSVIDFDDAMMHWYGMDIAQALNGLKSEVPSSAYMQKESVFLAGYASKFEIDPDLYARMPLFRRFANLVQYTRLVRSLHEKWENEPNWMVELRARLTGVLVYKSAHFGQALDADTDRKPIKVNERAPRP